ncbi:MAG TPA: hypothetical protein VIY86_13735, partial [Pirellulaceae bacterium]
SVYLQTQGVSSRARGSGGSGPHLHGRSATSAPPAPGREVPPPFYRPAGETVPSARGDTVSLRSGTDSSVNDDLALAPLEEERKPPVHPPAPASESQVKSEGEVAGQPSSSSVLSRETVANVESGPLDSLLKDKKFVRTAAVPRKQLVARQKHEESKAPAILLFTMLGLFGLALLILVVTLIVSAP